MFRWLKSAPKTEITVNYVGSAAYYLLAAGWLAVCAHYLAKLTYFVMLPSSIDHTIVINATSSGVPMSSDYLGHFAGIVVMAFKPIVVAVLVIGAPFFTAKLLAPQTRWWLRQASARATLKSLLRCKLYSILGLFVVILLGFYDVQVGVADNLFSFACAALGMSAAALFWLQYRLARVWHIDIKRVL